MLTILIIQIPNTFEMNIATKQTRLTKMGISIMNNNTVQNQQAEQPSLRDVTSVARLFKFSRPVFMTESVWHDCVEMIDYKNHKSNNMAELQRLRHILFMAASAAPGRGDDQEYNFRIYRIPNEDINLRRPEPVDLLFAIENDEFNNPVITIKLPDE